MGLFSRIFGPKQEAPPEVISEALETMEKYATGIMAHYGEENFKGDTQAKQVLSLYCFGGLGALAIQHKMSQPQALCDCLGAPDFLLWLSARGRRRKGTSLHYGDTRPHLPPLPDHP